MSKECPSCAMEVAGNAKVCPVCGYEFPMWKKGYVFVALLLLAISAFYLLRNLF